MNQIKNHAISTEYPGPGPPKEQIDCCIRLILAKFRRDKSSFLPATFSPTKFCKNTTFAKSAGRKARRNFEKRVAMLRCIKITQPSELIYGAIAPLLSQASSRLVSINCTHFERGSLKCSDSYQVNQLIIF